MKKIVLGFKQFQSSYFKKNKTLFSQLAKQQSPEILFITCSDSRIDPNLLTQTEPGELFVIRNAGNIIPPYTKSKCGFAASIEFAVQVIGVKHVIVCGHSDCGAMKGALHPSKISKLTDVKNWLDYSKGAAEKVKSKNYKTAINQLHEVAKQNILLQIHNLRSYPAISQKLAVDTLDIHGWFYDIGHGLMESYDSSVDNFITLDMMYSKLIEER
ncbi:MAG: carbonic anhydrase [Betaproteobacteria bacterium TMED41]|nr:MAG: carbonic anhydrase [Betaproteobacteria bacterium TMED41]